MSTETASTQFSIRHLIAIITLVAMVLAGWNWIINGATVEREWLPIIEVPYFLVGPGIQFLPVIGVGILLAIGFVLFRFPPVPVSIVLFIGFLPAIFFIGPRSIATMLICFFASSLVILVEIIVRKMSLVSYSIPTLCLSFTIAIYLWICCLLNAI